MIKNDYDQNDQHDKKLPKWQKWQKNIKMTLGPMDHIAKMTKIIKMSKN